MRYTDFAKTVPFLDSWLAYRARQADIPGFSVAVLSDDRMVFSRAYGLAELERHIPLTTNHLFHVASQTKMLTAVAIMQLAQIGKLGLDDPVCLYLAWLAEHRDKRTQAITIRHLLAHTSGLLRDGDEADHWLFKKPSPTTAALRALVLKNDLVFRPGKTLKYSNIGYSLLGQVIEKISAQSYTSYIKHAVHKRLALDMAADYQASLGQKIPVGYGLPFGHQRSAMTPRQSSRALVAATGTYASCEAMCRLVSALFLGNNVLINDALKQEMQRTQKVAKGYDAGVCFGLGHEIEHVGTHRLIGHTGHVGGHVSATYFDPRQKVAVSVATNAKDMPARALARGIFGALDFFATASPTDLPTQAPAFNVRLYNEMSTVQVVQNGEQIVMIDPDSWEPFEWYESLEIVDHTWLRVVTPGSIYNQGEMLHVHFNKNKIDRVRLAGFTLFPVSDKET